MTDNSGMPPSAASDASAVDPAADRGYVATVGDKRDRLPASLTRSSEPARLWSPLEQGRVQCHLSPRECKIPIGGLGFCGVRYNDGGTLVTLNYGKSVPMTQETIETEAVYHYAPGARILSMGNIGCMMKCDFCHNWQTSQARLARDQDIVAYSPEQVVEYALRHDIKVLSWTYNDPVVWHEFVTDTARLGKKHGLINLFKSAFYIGPAAVDELLEVIDIFSLSLKSMNPEHYRKYTGGHLQPVLDAILQVYRARSGGTGPHLELSNLCVTGRNDNLADSDLVARWMLDHLDDEIPLHYVRFHPDFQYTGVERTNVAFLEEARRSAMAMGMRYVYVGNVFDTPSVNTSCPGCGELLVERYGLMAKVNLRNGSCPRCDRPGPITAPFDHGHHATTAITDRVDLVHHFRGAVQSIHVEQDHESPIEYQFVDASGQGLGTPSQSTCTRFMISKAFPSATAVRIIHAAGQVPRLYEVFDRAHFPTVDLATAVADNDRQPLPLLRKRP
jgi:pyruvate formate lyase activating enzyme